MKNYYILFALIFSINLSNYCQNSLRVGDPQKWGTYQGTIEEAVVSVKPKGTYNEYGLYLTFSSRGTPLTTVNDTLEVVLKFQLPEKAIVHDSWLFMKDWISKGKILDKWTATQIYEDIVDRRKDPSILSKTSATNYELRVFPMAGNETRKVKISYLLPANLSSKGVSSQLPIDLLKTSNQPLQSLGILSWDSETFKNPKLSNKNIKFISKTDGTHGNYYDAFVPLDLLNSDLSINFEHKSDNSNIYLQQFSTDDNDNFYQLFLSSEMFLENEEFKKVLILIDYDQENTNLTANEVLNKTKLELLKNLKPKDYFNIMLSNISTKKFREDWVSATEENINLAFTELDNSLASYSNLSNLLGSSIEYINKDNDQNSQILLISNSDQYTDEVIANDFTNDLVALLENNNKINVIDYQEKNFKLFSINGRRYFGNEYIYNNISKITLGSFNQMYESNSYWYTQYVNSFSEVISNAFKNIGGTINALDIYTTLENGYCYNRFNLSKSENISYVSEPILQVGKFDGEFPFSIDITGEFKGNVFSKKIKINEENIIKGDSITEKIWAGQYLRNLENTSRSNSIINDIVSASKEFTVLSKYTSFLCLEEKEDYACFDCFDESVLEVNSLNIQDDFFSFYPNPFIDGLTIEIVLRNGEKVKNLKIIDLNGKTIHNFDTSNFTEGKNKIVYKPNLDLTSGIYIINYATNKNNYNIKLIKK